MSYTKGEWRNGGEAILDEDGNWICQFFDKFEDDFDNGEANARIISKAPEMLEMLKTTTALARLKYGNLDADVDEYLSGCEALISEIEGNEE